MIYQILPFAKFASKGLRQDKCMLGGIAMRRILQVYLAEIVKQLKMKTLSTTQSSFDFNVL